MTERRYTEDEVAEIFRRAAEEQATGASRPWSNGSLRATLERTDAGDRLRIRTLKGDARGLVHGGLALLGIAAALLLAMIVAGDAGSVSGASSPLGDPPSESPASGPEGAP